MHQYWYSKEQGGPADLFSRVVKRQAACSCGANYGRVDCELIAEGNASCACGTQSLKRAVGPPCGQLALLNFNRNGLVYRIETVARTVGYRDRCEDRVEIFRENERTVIVVADGAGGMGSGEIAAKSVVREVELAYKTIGSSNDWCTLLRQIDCRISDGGATAVVVDIRPYGIAGASVGDSQAWIVYEGEITDLTANQVRKPLLGSGAAEPSPFTNEPLRGKLIVGTDGFFNYVKREKFTPVISTAEFYSIPRRCIEMVRLPSGDLWDDIGIVAARVIRERTKKRYTL